MTLVVGSTGSLGGQICRGLLAQGRPVQILVRPGSNYRSLIEADATPVFGDLKERPSLDAACRGVDTVITTAISLGRGIDDTIESVDRAGNRNLVLAAAEAGVRNFIFVSALGASSDNPNPFMAAKAATEALVGSSGMTWTILAPNAFMDVWLAAVVAGPALAGGEVVYVGSGARRHSFVHSRDVAAFALAALDSPAAANRYLPIGGPAPVSIRQSVAIFEGVLRRPIPQRGVAPGDDVPGMPPFMAQMLATQDTFDSPMEMVETAQEFGVHLTSVEKWAASLVPVAVGRGTPGERPGGSLPSEAGWQRGAAHIPAAGTAPSHWRDRPARSREAGHMRRRLAALATGTLLLVALTMPGPANATGGGGGGPPAAVPLVPRIVATFPAGEGGSFAESMVADQKGNLFASVTDWMPEGASNVGQIWQISRDGVSPFGFRLDAGGGLLTGVAFDDEGQLYVGDATFGYGLAPGVFRVTAGAPPTRVLSLPDFAFPNGLAFHAGYLFVSDSNGAIWRVRPRVDAVAPPSPWIEDPLLRPVAGWEGVNGIAFLGNDLYAVNADTGTVIRVPVLRDGSPGSPLVVASDSALVTADGVAFDDDGDFWIAVNHESGGALARVTRDGSVTVVVSDPGWLDYPSQPVFGQSGSARTTLYVENGSLSNGTPNVIALGVGVRGPLP